MSKIYIYIFTSINVICCKWKMCNRRYFNIKPIYAENVFFKQYMYYYNENRQIGKPLCILDIDVKVSSKKKLLNYVVGLFVLKL